MIGYIGFVEVVLIVKKPYYVQVRFKSFKYYSCGVTFKVNNNIELYHKDKNNNNHNVCNFVVLHHTQSVAWLIPNKPGAV